MKSVTWMPALRADFRRPWPAQEEPSVSVNKLHARVHVNQFGHFIGDADRLQDAHDLIVEVYSTREMISGIFTFENDCGYTTDAKQIGQGRSHRAVPNDRDIVSFCRCVLCVSGQLGLSVRL